MYIPREIEVAIDRMLENPRDYAAAGGGRPPLLRQPQPAAHHRRGAACARASGRGTGLWDTFWSGYVSAYLERDVRDLIDVRDEMKFYNFMVACAARSRQPFNASDRPAATEEGWVRHLNLADFMAVGEELLAQ